MPLNGARLYGCPETPIAATAALFILSAPKYESCISKVLSFPITSNDISKSTLLKSCVRAYTIEPMVSGTNNILMVCLHFSFFAKSIATATPDRLSFA